MATSPAAVEENIKCSICYDIFKDPVILPCSHSFCKTCLETVWRQNPVKICPLCRQTTTQSPVKNLALMGVCESVEEKRRRISVENLKVFCVVHGLKHELYCINDKKLVCLKCVSEDHKNHNFCSINKAAEEHKNKLQKPLQDLGNKLQTLTSRESTFTIIAAKLQTQGQQTETQIKEEFKKLQQFLKEEEETRLSALRDEQKRKTEGVKNKIAEVKGWQTYLSERIQSIKDDSRDDSLFLHKFRETEERVRCTVPDVKLDSRPLIDVAQHMGNLRYRVLEKMKHLSPCYPVVLNPNTKTNNLEVSPDLTSIRCSEITLQTPPEKRFCSILGSEGFSSGVHTWQVDVEGCEHWALGVVTESAKRLQSLSSCSFLVSYINGKCSWTPKAAKVKIVCVSLDMLRDQVVFSDPDTSHTMVSYRCEFTEKMYPCFFPLSVKPMKILPSTQRSSSNPVLNTEQLRTDNKFPKLKKVNIDHLRVILSDSSD